MGLEVAFKFDTTWSQQEEASSLWGPDNYCCLWPRLLVVHTRPNGNSIVFVVAHAPHEGTAEDDKDSWWALLHTQIQKFSFSGHLIILGDLNARIGKSVPGCVGELVCDQTTDNGERLLSLLETPSLWIPATYSDIHRGHSWTWTHPRGPRARLDYVVLGQSTTLWANSTKGDSSIQTSLTVRLQFWRIDMHLYCRYNMPLYIWSILKPESDI